jgi:hypothetical protein
LSIGDARDITERAPRPAERSEEVRGNPRLVANNSRIGDAVVVTDARQRTFVNDVAAVNPGGTKRRPSVFP